MKQIPSLPDQHHVATQQPLFPLLAKRGIAAAWATAADARSEVAAECQEVRHSSLDRSRLIMLRIGLKIPIAPCKRRRELRAGPERYRMKVGAGIA